MGLAILFSSLGIHISQTWKKYFFFFFLVESVLDLRKDWASKIDILFMIMDSNAFIQILRRGQRNISGRAVQQTLSIQSVPVSLPGREEWSRYAHDILNPHGLEVFIKVKFLTVLLNSRME